MVAKTEIKTGIVKLKTALSEKDKSKKDRKILRGKVKGLKRKLRHAALKTAVAK